MNDRNTILQTKHSLNQIVKILREQLDVYPSLLKCLLTLNARYWKGSSRVCGIIDEDEFELRNRQGPGFSLIARGKLSEVKSGTRILLTFSKPNFIMRLQSLFLNRYEDDRKVILDFLGQWLQTEKP